LQRRYDMPIGVEGDAGRVAAIYVEAGDHVKRGQVLGVSMCRCCNRRSPTSKRRSSRRAPKPNWPMPNTSARRPSAPPVALSAEETQRRKSTGVTAAAKVKVAAAQLAEAEARLARAEVRAPSDGVILTRQCRGGADGDAWRRGPVSLVGRR